MSGSPLPYQQRHQLGGGDPLAPWGDHDPDAPIGPTHGAWAVISLRQLHACAHTTDTLGYKLTRNGVRQYHLVCSQCGTQRSRLLSKETAQATARMLGINFDDVLCFQDNQMLTDPVACEACGAERYDLHTHHWAPRHLFGVEADAWPTSQLCPPCHTRWHRIVTPDMAKGEWLDAAIREAEDAGEVEKAARLKVEQSRRRDDLARVRR